jgi:AcrR family transcriptional regulator
LRGRTDARESGSLRGRNVGPRRCGKYQDSRKATDEAVASSGAKERLVFFGESRRGRARRSHSRRPSDRQVIVPAVTVRRNHRRALPKPKQARSIATREAILDATSLLARERGVATLTTREVAERAGVGTGTLYQYFPSREALEAAWELREIERAFGEMAGVVRGLFEQPIPLEEAIARVTRAAIEMTERHVAAFGRAELVTRWSERWPAARVFHEFIADALRATSERERLHEADYEVAAELLVLFIVQATIRFTARTDDPVERRARAREEIVRFVLRYLVRTPGPASADGPRVA